MRQRTGTLQGEAGIRFAACAVALAEAPPAQRRLPLTEVELLELALEAVEPHELGWHKFVDEPLAGARLRAGRVQDNIDHLEGVAEDYREEYPDTWLWLRCNLADSYRIMGRPGLVFEHLAETREALESAPVDDSNRADIAFYLTALEGINYMDLGIIDQAARLFEECDRLAAGPYASLDDIAATYDYRAYLLNATSRPAEVIPLLDRALADERLAEYHGGFLLGQGHALSRLEKEGTRPAGGAREKLLAARQRQLTAEEQLGVTFGLALLQMQSAEDDLSVVERLDEVDRQLERDFDQSDDPVRARMAVLRSQLGLRLGEDRAQLEQRLADLEASYEEQLAEWDAAPSRPGGVGYLRYGARQEVLRELAALSLHLRGPQAGAEAALGYLMQVRSRGSVARSLGGDSPEFAGLARGENVLRAVREQLLEPGHGALVYLPGDPGRSLVIAIDDERIEAIELPAPWVWRAESRRLQQLLRAQLLRPGKGSGFDDLTQHLAGALLPLPVQERLATWEAVTIVGRDLVGPVPFELLPLAGRRALGLELAVDYLPSLFLGCVLAARETAPVDAEHTGPRLSVIAAPTEGPGDTFERIPWVDDQAGPWRASYGRGAVRVATGAQATAAALSAPQTVASTVLHMIVHGDWKGSWERPAALVLTPDPAHPDGRLWAPDIERMHLPGLVVLSVCGAARGPERIGDELAGNLGGALLRAGANTAVLSPIDLEYGANMALMDVFHRRLARGDSPARAMLAARRELAGGTAYADPVHWAVVHVTGLGQRPLFPARERRAGAAAALVLSAVGLVLAGWLARRRRRAA